MQARGIVRTRRESAIKGLAALCAGVAAWCSVGTVALVGADAAPARVALLAPWWLLGVFVPAFFPVIHWGRLTLRQASALFGSSVVLLPWLPLPIPPAALLWVGPFNALVWLAVLASSIHNSQSTIHKAVGRTPPVARLADWKFPILNSASAAVLALALYAASAYWLAPVLPDGDAPHYLVITQSIVKDGDLQIENNHRRGDYLEYSLLAAEPDYLRRGQNGQIYSIHSPGLPAVVAPAYWLLGYTGVVGFLGLIAAASTGLVWHLSYRATQSAAAAWFGWATTALTTPFFFQATEVFPDGVAATCVLLGAMPMALASESPSESDGDNGSVAPWLVAGIALAILPWLQTRLAIVAAAAAVCLVARARSARQFAVFAAAPIISAAAWFGYFRMIYGTFNPAAPYGTFTQTSVGNLPNGLAGILFDQQFGLFANAPVAAVVSGGIVISAFRGRRWGLELLALVVPYTIGVAMYQHWWGGTSVPARLLTGVALVGGIGAARVWHETRTAASRVLLASAFTLSVAITLVLMIPDRGRLLLNFRDGVALWLEWSNPLVNLPAALPSLFTDTPAHAVLRAAIWTAMGAAVWFVLIALERLRPGRSHFGAPSIWCLAIGAMLAMTLGWRLDRVEPLTPATSELRLLADASPLRPAAFDFQTWSLTSPEDLLARVRVRSSPRRPRANSQQLLAARSVPAGAYRVVAFASNAPQGALTMTLGSNAPPFLTVPLPLTTEPVVTFPVAVQSLVVDADRAAQGSIATVELVPEFPERIGHRSGLAHRAARYASGDAFFLDENAYAEPTGFWVAGGRAARIVTTRRSEVLRIALRNSPVDNVVTIDGDGIHEEIALGPGEERTVSLTPETRPSAGGEATAERVDALRISSRSGFRPSQAEPGNRDLRYLGCWVELR